MNVFHFILDVWVIICKMEVLQANHKHKNFPGLHREGTTVNSLFGLYFWDALYLPVSDVFRSPHQASPLDLDDPNFYAARKEWIDRRQVLRLFLFFVAIACFIYERKLKKCQLYLSWIFTAINLGYLFKITCLLVHIYILKNFTMKMILVCNEYTDTWES